uniref:Uncharacterized protein n=1 Tax=Setaria italica TaxID=4555 RepID=K4A3U1_SETIT
MSGSNVASNLASEIGRREPWPVGKRWSMSLRRWGRSRTSSSAVAVSSVRVSAWPRAMAVEGILRACAPAQKKSFTIAGD